MTWNSLHEQITYALKHQKHLSTLKIFIDLQVAHQTAHLIMLLHLELISMIRMSFKVSTFCISQKQKYNFNFISGFEPSLPNVAPMTSLKSAEGIQIFIIYTI